jgi:signal transduction histidine kinase
MVTPLFISDQQQLPLVLPINALYNTICVGVTLWVLGWGLRELSGHERQLARMIIVGVVFLSLPLAFLSLNTFQQDLMVLPSLIHLTLLPLAILPILSDYVLFRHQLLGNTSLFSRRIMRVLLWLLLASLFIFPTIILLRTLDQGGTPSEEMRNYLYTGLLLGSLWLFPQAWNKLRDVGDTFLYHDFYQYNRSLREISRELTQLRGLGQICIFLLPRLANMLNASDVALLVRTERDRTQQSGQGAQQGWQCYGGQTSKKTLAQEHLRGVADLALTHLRQPQDEPLLIDGVLVTPLYDGEQVRGLLCLGAKHNLEPYERQDKSFLMTLAAQLAVLEVNSRYLERAQADALQLAALSSRVVCAQEEERRHLAMELHDDALQQAMLLSRQLADARDMTEVAEAMPLARSIVSSLRHTCLELRPPLLDELGLCEALNWLAKQNEQRSGRQQVRIRLIVQDASAYERLAVPIELALYRVIQEALSNILKHANASQVVIKLHQNREGLLTVLVGDNGRGFRPGLVRTERLGLVGMHERMRSIGGEFRIRSTPGRGTCVRARIETSAHSKQTGNESGRNEGQPPLKIETLEHTDIQT